MITKDELRAVLQDCEAAGLPERLDDDTPIALDSFALVWLRHLLQERHQVVLDVTGSELDTLDSVNAVHAFLAGAQSDPAGPAGDGEDGL